MIAYLQGKIKYRTLGWLILEVNNVGYKIFTNANGQVDESLTLFIHHHLREDISDLYGFIDFEELSFFELLLSVSGVGPKVALAILSGSPVNKIKQAIIKGDTTMLTAVGGVGKKLAAKIIVELKSKLGEGSEELIPEEGGEAADVVEALEQLGYKRVEILRILRAMPDDLANTQAKLTWALQRMRK